MRRRHSPSPPARTAKAALPMIPLIPMMLLSSMLLLPPMALSFQLQPPSQLHSMHQLHPLRPQKSNEILQPQSHQSHIPRQNGRQTSLPMMPALSSLSSLPALSSLTTASSALSTTLTTIASPLGSIAVLAFVILVHESGHFLAARSLGMNVDEFSVGVGPRLLGVKRTELEGGEVVYEWINDANDANDGDDANAEEEERGAAVSTVSAASAVSDGSSIEFSLRALPLGGYVRFPENYNRTLAFEQEDAARRARNEARRLRLEGDGDDGDKVGGASTLEKVLESVAAKSFVANALTLGWLMRWVKKREEEQLRLAEEEVQRMGVSATGGGGGGGSFWSALPWVKTNNDKNNGGDSSQENEVLTPEAKLKLLQSTQTPPIEYYDDPNLLQNRPWTERALVLSGGVIFNILLAFVCYFGELNGVFSGGKGGGLPMPVFDRGAVVASVNGVESPSFGILKEGDVIVAVNDVSTSPSDGKKGVYASQSEISSVISSIRDTPDGETIKLTILHQNPTAATASSTASTQEETVTIAPQRRLDPLGQPTGPQSIGVLLAPNYLRTDIVRATSFLDGISKAYAAVYELTSETARSLLGFLTSLLVGQGLPAGTSMSGPIGVVQSGAKVVSTSDFAAVVAFAASISVNLAVINSLPLPALDGGQLLFVLAEAVAGRKMDQRLQEGINAGALLILLVISFGTAVGDVTSIFF